MPDNKNIKNKKEIDIDDSQDNKNPDGIDANVLFSEFKENSVADFFKKNRQMLGLYGKQRTLTTIIHEIVTNSLDACEEAGILPEIEVKLSEISEEYFEISVIDNGPGIPENKIGSALGKLLAGTKFHRLVQTRGQQGIGVSGIILFSQITTGKPTKVISGTTTGKTVSLEISIDSKTNSPKITEKIYLDKKFRGLAIKSKFKEIQYKKGQNSVDEYLRRTAISNPHATIKFEDPSGEITLYPRSVKKLPKIPKQVKPHPRGVTVDEMLSLARYSPARKVSSYLLITYDRFGQTAVDNVAKLVHFDLNKDPKKLTWDEAEEIVKAIKQTKFIAPNTENLVPIGEPFIEKSLKSVIDPEFCFVNTRKPSVYKGGYAFQVEVGLAYGGQAGRLVSLNSAKVSKKKKEEAEEASENGETIREVRVSEIIRYSNKAPLLFDAGGCVITKTVSSIDWKRYGISNIDSAPISIFVNLISVHIPYTSAGKSAIADEEEIVTDLKLALQDVARRLGKFLIDKKRDAEKKEKRKVFSRYSPYVVEAIVHTVGGDPKILQKNLDKMVLEKLKMDDENEKHLSSKPENIDDDFSEENDEMEE
ncbi:MAG: DNA topoisomerase VI subunit B [Candidatus ainarchaeum sp.]|nr:DNA topoisomerase VI subunit B [Candidatus ainarchaeum sp.]